MCAYNYSYAEPTEVEPRKFQLEFWDHTRRKGGWFPVVSDVPYRTWRKVRVGHTHKDKLAHSIARVRSSGYARDRFEQCQRYCAWARGAGLTEVTVFAGCYDSIRASLEAGLRNREVHVADFIGDAPAAELES